MASGQRGPGRKSVRGEILNQAVTELTRHPPGYPALLDELKRRIRAAQLKAALSVNRELIRLYWQIGSSLARRQRTDSHGSAIVSRLAADLHREFPGIRGFSPQNFRFMRAFYRAWTEGVAKRQQAVGVLDGRSLPTPVEEIPWGHNIQLITRVKDPVERLWYAGQAVEHGWSRAVLVHQIESDLFRRQGKAITNFQSTLPPHQSDLAQQVLKDPYNFDFLTLTADTRERELERGLLAHLRKFLLELGAGFAFVGEQHRLEVAGEDFSLDLLFYHLRLRCFVVIDLKIEPFKPEFAGKMSFYLSAVDKLLRHENDERTIGLILCKEKNHLVVEYALQDLRKPVGVSAYRITKRLPDRLKGSLPTIEQLATELSHGKRLKSPRDAGT